MLGAFPFLPLSTQAAHRMDLMPADLSWKVTVLLCCLKTMSFTASLEGPTTGLLLCSLHFFSWEYKHTWSGFWKAMPCSMPAIKMNLKTCWNCNHLHRHPGHQTCIQTWWHSKILPPKIQSLSVCSPTSSWNLCSEEPALISPSTM